jgi:hypothetical protein
MGNCVPVNVYVFSMEEYESQFYFFYGLPFLHSWY